MWSSAQSATSEAWAAALVQEGKEYGNDVVTAAANALCAARKFNEIYVGGDNTSCLVQLLASGQEQDSSHTDVLASVLLPLEEVRIAYTARGHDAYHLLCSFWQWSPSSPALIASKGSYHQLMCKVPGKDSTEGILGPGRIAALQRHAAERLEIYVPGEEDPGADVSRERGARDTELERAAICRR
jgi:hypothetical protein